MPNHRNRFPARRRFLKQSTALTASVVALPLPQLARAGRKENTEGPAPPAPDAGATQPKQAPRRRRALKP